MAYSRHVARVTPLKLAIVASGLRAYEVADRIGRSEPELSRWATGRRTPPEDVQRALADVLGQPAEALFPESAEAAA